VIATLLARAIAGDEVSAHRVAAVTERNFVLLRGAGSYGWLVAAGFAEPLLYLLAVGWGVGSLIGSVTLPDGQEVAYRTFLAPAMLATYAMNGALAESTINFFAKLKYWKLYSSMINTPVTPEEIAIGELGWAMARVALYGGPFLVFAAALGLVAPPLALAALPAALLTGMAFGGLGLALSTFMRGWDDFRYVGIVQFALFMFSGTFAPTARYPEAVRLLVQVLPLSHGVELLRGIAMGQIGWSLAWHAAYLAAVAAAGLAIASRRMRRLLWP
jgi:lipooligosaccharide transport system permease protein